MSKSEAALLRRAQQGERTAFVEIYQQNYTAIYNYVFYRVDQNETVAQDITAEVFTRMIGQIKRFTYRKQTILAWLYRIAHNLVIDHYRQHGREAQLQHKWAPRQPAPDPAAVTQWHMTQQELAAALCTLTDDQQQVILLKFVEGCSNAEIGRRLGKTEGAIKSLQHRALASMKRVLTEEQPYEQQL